MVTYQRIDSRIDEEQGLLSLELSNMPTSKKGKRKINAVLFLNFDNLLINTFKKVKKETCFHCFKITKTSYFSKIINLKVLKKLNLFAKEHCIALNLITTQEPSNLCDLQLFHLIEKAGGFSEDHIGGFRRSYIHYTDHKLTQNEQIEKLFNKLKKLNPELRKRDCSFIKDMSPKPEETEKICQEDYYHIISGDKEGRYLDVALEHLRTKIYANSES